MKQSQISIESYHKLNRAKNLLHFLHLDLIQKDINGMQQFVLPPIVSYIADDLRWVLSELKQQGFCDHTLKK